MKIPSLLLVLAVSSVASAQNFVPEQVNSRGIAFPAFRYVEYSRLSSETISALNSLGYTEETWNVPGTDPIELISFENLAGAQPVVESLGFDRDSWDCFVAHYNSDFFDWRGLLDEGVQIYFSTLGYTRSIWEEGLEAPIKRAQWLDLSLQQRAAATELCWFDRTWNSVPLPEYPGGSAETAPPTAAPPTLDLAARGLHNSPADFRHVPFRFLDSDVKDLAESMGYTEASWNYVEQNSFDLIKFEDLPPSAQNSVLELGYESAEAWDCYVNHYKAYDWEDLSPAGVQEYYRNLGWDRESWNGNIEAPESDSSAWDELTEDEQQNLIQLCWIEPTWNEEDLMTWGDIPPTTMPSVEPSMAPSSNPTTEAPSLSPTSTSEDDSAVGIISGMVVSLVLVGSTFFALVF